MAPWRRRPRRVGVGVVLGVALGVASPSTLGGGRRGRRGGGWGGRRRRGPRRPSRPGRRARRSRGPRPTARGRAARRRRRAEARQPRGSAIRVPTAAPQSRHHSCSALRRASQRGQRRSTGVGGGGVSDAAHGARAPRGDGLAEVGGGGRVAAAGLPPAGSAGAARAGVAVLAPALASARPCARRSAPPPARAARRRRGRRRRWAARRVARALLARGDRAVRRPRRRGVRARSLSGVPQCQHQPASLAVQLAAGGAGAADAGLADDGARAVRPRRGAPRARAAPRRPRRRRPALVSMMSRWPPCGEPAAAVDLVGEAAEVAQQDLAHAAAGSGSGGARRRGGRPRRRGVSSRSASSPAGRSRRRRRSSSSRAAPAPPRTGARLPRGRRRWRRPARRPPAFRAGTRRRSRRVCVSGVATGRSWAAGRVVEAPRGSSIGSASVATRHSTPPALGRRPAAAPRLDDAGGHPVGREQLGAAAALDPRVGGLEVGASAARQARGPTARSTRRRCLQHDGVDPTGVPNAGTPHAVASITDRPKPSACDGTRRPT